MTLHTAIPEDRLEPPPTVQFRCPECGRLQDVAVCKCGDPLCEKCDPEHAHMRCLPPEQKALLLDCLTAFMRIQDALNRSRTETAFQIAQAYRAMLQEKGVGG